ncbi:MAG: chromophore lyase CpcT/CpeT [Woeseiaceae bacterium]|nr:chromophore lyase CpcT/CpeT [Woeseiaceae bacterium]
MSRKHPLAALSLCLILLGSTSGAQQPAYDMPVDPNARDLVLLTQWFAGEFDNEEQLWFQADRRSNTEEVDRHPRLHTTHRRLDLPQFGEHVFYVEEYRDNDPQEVIRQRFVIFSSLGPSMGIRMQQGFFKDTEMARGAQFDPERLAGLKSDDVFFLDECDVYWHRFADQFEGEIRPKSCVFGEGKLRRYSVHKMWLSQDKYWRIDATRLVADDSLHVGLAEDNPTQLRRAHAFRCAVSFRLADGTSQKVENLKLHSQGGEASIDRKDDGEKYILRLRDKEYPYYDARPDFLFLSIRKAGERRSVAYTVADPDARRLGVSAGDTLADCYRDGYNFQQSIDELE